MTGRKEAAIARDVVAALQLSGAYAIRQHVGSYSTKGWPDIYAIVPGCCTCGRPVPGLALHLEVKRERGGRLSVLQDYTLSRLRLHGARAGMVRSAEEAMEAVRLIRLGQEGLLGESFGYR